MKTRTPWYPGWNIVAAATLLTMLTVGMRLGIGPFFLPMAEDLGFSRSLLASIIGVGMLCYGLAMPLAGYLVGRLGTRFVLLLGTAIVFLSTAWTVTARTPVSFLLAFGVLMSFGLGFTSPVALTPVISRWFTRQRGMALFFLSTGSMAGMAVLTPVLALAIARVGWQQTLLGFAVIFAVVTIPAALFIIRDDAPAGTDLLPAAAGSMPQTAPPAQASLGFAAAVRTAPFLKIVFGLFACGFSMNLLGTHGVPMLMDHGFDAMTSSYGIGLIGLVAILGTLVLGRLSDRTARRNILGAIYFVRGLGFFALLMVGTHWELYIAAAIGGLVWAGSIATSSAMLADIYGVRLVGLMYGTAYLGHQVGAMLSSWLGGWAFERFGTHWVAFGTAGLLLLAAAAVSMRLPLKGFTLMGPALAVKG
ncbi:MULTISPECIES: MFS transporter [unclassified Massilia]|uniref:MFS transporter n=1 Tax=unclassified Massilia TaxID=2609279 RepID=UPI00178623ED|nr:MULTISPECIES: MFS transporter [unclassified Massilia]MBD8531967.1 MFS transporter [Massilia sp. CFBP 13647]MBD8675419.1 MFS transporter [Massilia sp. CFBP 13721]